MIQITGRYEYTRIASDFNMALDQVAGWLVTPDGAAMSAGWLWDASGLNFLADGDEITEITLRINGSLSGLDERKAAWNAALAAI